MEPLAGSGSSVSDSKVLIDGLRLRLDLRIVPGEAGADAAAAAVWRIENAAVATLRLGVPVAYRRAAIASGLGALALAIGVWLFGPTTAESEHAGRAPSDAAHESAARSQEHTATPRVAPRSTDPALTPLSPAATASPPPPLPAPVDPAARSSSVTSPPGAALSSAAGPAASASGGASAAPLPAPPSNGVVVPPRAAHPVAGNATSHAGNATSHTAGEIAAGAAPAAEAAPSRPAGEVGGAARQPARGRLSLSSARERDMLELFGDPK